MKRLRKSKTGYIIRTYGLPVLTVLLILLLMLGSAVRFTRVHTEQDKILTEQAIKKAVVQCFADEGRYPADIDYIEKNYNLKIDYDRFYVNYDCAAANVFPNIAVFRKDLR